MICQKKKQKIKDIFPNVLVTGAVLTAVVKRYPDFITNIGLTESDARSFDIWYIANSGERSISNLLKMLTNSNRLTLVTDDNQRLVVDNNINLVGVKGLVKLDSDTLAQVIRDMFQSNWKRFFSSFNWTYDPTKPYSMSVKDVSSENRNSSNSNTSTGRDTSNTDSNSTDENKVSAFNSSEYQPDNLSMGEGHTTYEQERSSTWGGTTEGTTKTDRDITREGNIGNKTVQELLEEERQLYVKTFFDYVKQDLDRVLSIPIYDY